VKRTDENFQIWVSVSHEENDYQPITDPHLTWDEAYGVLMNLSIPCRIRYVIRYVEGDGAKPRDVTWRDLWASGIMT
jgi:hypothetical protein